MVPPLVEWNVAIRALDGESGDQYMVCRTPDGGVLVAVVDGLGHGPEAASAAKTAIAELEAAAGADLGAQLRRCHERLRDTRGAVVSLALFAPTSLTWLGVGNVDGVLLRAPRALPSTSSCAAGWWGAGCRRSKCPGWSWPGATSSSSRRMAFKDHFADEPGAALGTPPTAERILVDYGKETDDALVMVVQYLGPTPEASVSDRLARRVHPGARGPPRRGRRGGLALGLRARPADPGCPSRRPRRRHDAPRGPAGRLSPPTG